MTATASQPFQPTDTLWLWWLHDPARPVLIGELTLVRALRGVSLRYDAAWLQSGFALSEDLPLKAGEFLPAAKDSAAGAVDDARPDRWGERVIRFLEKPSRLSLLEYLYFAGDERFGALGVSVSKDAYQTRHRGPLPVLADVSAMAEWVERVAAGEPIPEAARRLLAPGATMGGARPKALLTLDGEHWVLKFAEAGDVVDVPLAEHAAMTLAARAQVEVALTLPIALPAGHALAVQRFDRLKRERGWMRLHAQSAGVALRAAGEDPAYPELAQLLRRRGVAAGSKGRMQMAELFRRMVFNILIDNTDDHEKNHALLMTDQGELALAPAFDVVPSGHALGYQQMGVGAMGTDATLDNALSQHQLFGLSRADAEAQLRLVAGVVEGWKAHFAAAGLSARDIESLAQQIDRPFLQDQRKAWLARS